MASERTVLVRLRAEVSGFNRGLAEAAAGVAALRREINTTNERTAWLTQGIAAIAPALVPLGAAGVPVIAGLAAQMTVAGVAAGTLALGFDGIGGAVKALNTYQLTPTVENLTKLQQAMDKIGPDGEKFVEFLDHISPQLTALQMDARAGMFPGMEEGITHLLTLLPQVRDIVSQVAEGIGQLSAEAGKNLAGPKFEEFFNFLDTDAKPILIEMGHTVGNLADGLTALFVDLVPEARGFSSGLERASESFAKWAHSVDDTQGFQDFIAYVNQSGPQALDFLEALGKTFLALVEAAAPVGSHLLPLFTKMLDVLAAIASTPLGSTALALASLVSVYGRLAAIGSNFTTGSWGAGFSRQTEAIRTGLPTYRQFGSTLQTLAVNYMTAGAASERMTAQTAAARAALTQWGRTVGPVASQAALLGVIMTGTDKKLGLTNTTSLALAGSMAGPVGTAVGALTGMTLDLAAANNDLTDSQKRANDAFNSSDYSAQVQSLHNLQAATDDYRQSIRDAFDPTKMGSPTDTFRALSEPFTHAAAEAQAAAHQHTLDMMRDQSSLMAIGQGLGNKDMQDGQPFAADTTKGIAELQAVANRAQPAMDALSITIQDLRAAAAANDGTWTSMTNRIVEWTKNSETAAGRTRNISNALTGLDGRMVATQQAAGALKSAMDALFAPKMGVNATHNAMLEGLRALNSQLNKNSKAILGNSNAALQNQDAVRGQVQRVLDYVQALADSGAGSRRVTAAYQQQRQALIDQAAASGISREAMVKYLRTLGMTPKAVSTLIQLPGLTAAQSGVSSLRTQLEGLNGRVFRATVMVTRQGVSDITATGGHVMRADGGIVRGPGGPRDDMIPAALSNGEFVVNAHATARNLALLEEINRRKFADGGFVSSAGAVSGSGAPADTSDVGHAAHETASHLKTLGRSAAESQKSIDKEKQARDNLVSAERSLAQSVRDSFRSQFLDVEPDSVWAKGAGNPFSILRGDIRNATAYKRALADLKHRGVDGQFAAQITTLAGAQQVDALSNQQLHRLEHLFRERQHMSAVAGQLEGQTAYGKQIGQANRELAHANAHLRNLEQEIKHLRAEQHKHAKTAGQETGKVINGTSSSAARRVKR